jgi:hypothetical protein
MQKWQCPTSEQWEKFLLVEDPPDRVDLERHLENCPQCRFMLTQLNKEFERLQTVWDDSATPDIIYLSPLLLDATSGGPSPLELAAQGTQRDTEQDAITLASEDQQVLLRAVRDAHTKETWLYVVADDPTLYENVLVKLPLADQEFVTDAQGRVNLGVVDWPEKQLLAAEVRLPQATFAMNPFKAVEVGEAAELTSSSGDRVKVALTGEGHNYRLDIQILELSKAHMKATLKVAVRVAGTDKLVQIQPVVSDQASFGEIDAIEKLEVYLYQ